MIEHLPGKNKISLRRPAGFFCITLSVLVITFSQSCKKDSGSNTNPPADTSVVIVPPVEAELAKTIGFFIDEWTAKSFTAPSYTEKAVPTGEAYIVNVNPSNIITKIPQSLFGNNSNLWMGQIVNEPQLMQDLTVLHPHIIRFPGGSISDVFFWNAPNGVPPSDAPDTLLDASGAKSKAGYWYGKNSENWTFSVDNYYNMLQQTHNQGIITINYGYARYGRGSNPVAAAAHLAADWVRYDNGRTKYWEIGNENFGSWEAGYRIDRSKNKDGQPEVQTSALYGQHFNVFADSMRKAAQQIGKTIKIGAVMVESNATANWNAGVIGQARNVPDFYVLHCYYTPYNTNSNAATVLSSALTSTPDIMNYIKSELLVNGADLRPIALDEWNIFATGSKQQVSFVNGMHAVLVLGEAIKNKFGLTARWDLANGWDNGNDHGMFSQGDEPGVPKWNRRPAFYYMYFFQKSLGDRLVESDNGGNSYFSTYASSFTSGQIGVTIVNRSLSVSTVKLNIKNFRVGSRFYWYLLKGGTDNGEFSRKVYVNDQGTDLEAGGPSNYATLPAYSASTANGIRVIVPPMSVICIVVDKK